MSTLVILQPSYLPWLGYFEQIYKADYFVFYDDVQYTKNDWRNRNKIKTANGSQWLTVPVKGSLSLKINEVKIDNTIPWRKKHLNSIKNSYSKAPFFKDYISIFEDFYSKEWSTLLDLDVEQIKMLSQLLGIETKFYFSSKLNVFGTKSQRLINFCKHLEVDTYYTGAAASNYLDTQLFKDNSIKVEYQSYQHPIYPQLFGKFQPYLSIIDLLFNCGPQSKKLILSQSI